MIAQINNTMIGRQNWRNSSRKYGKKQKWKIGEGYEN